MRLRNYLLLAVGMGTLTFVMGVTNADWAYAQASKIASVLVVNTPDQPVPTIAQGTTNIAGNVGISGTADVNATVVGTPTVNLGAGNSVGIGGPVQIGNAAGNPVLIRDVDNGARQPFHVSMTCGVSTGLTGCGNGISPSEIPVGKQLVVEYVSARMTLPAGQSIPSAEISTFTGSDWVTHYVPAISQGLNHYGEAVFIASEPVRMYAVKDGLNYAVTMLVNRSASVGVGSFIVEVSGYWIDLP